MKLMKKGMPVQKQGLSEKLICFFRKNLYPILIHTRKIILFIFYERFIFKQQTLRSHLNSRLILVSCYNEIQRINLLLFTHSK